MKKINIDDNNFIIVGNTEDIAATWKSMRKNDNKFVPRFCDEPRFNEERRCYAIIGEKEEYCDYYYIHVANSDTALAILLDLGKIN